MIKTLRDAAAEVARMLRSDDPGQVQEGALERLEAALSAPTPEEGESRLCPCGKPALPTASICSDCADACLASGEGEAPVAWIAPLELARMTDAFEETAWLNVVLFAENDQARVALYTRPDPEVPAPTALRLAISHIEHMAAWIAADNRGYSFEALGEDMATIKAGLTATPEGLRSPSDEALFAAMLQMAERAAEREEPGFWQDRARQHVANMRARPVTDPEVQKVLAEARLFLAALQPRAGEAAA